MKRRQFLNAMVGLTFAVAMTPRIALAAGSHLDQAISETRRAIHYGDVPHHESSFTEHVDNALDHAMRAQKAHPNPHIKRAIRELRRGRDIAYDTHSPRRERRGAAQAKKALRELQAAE
jgi:hypothetical protein